MIKKFENYSDDLEKFKLLKEKLLSLGGNNVKETYEEDVDKLLSNGILFDGKSKLVKMRQSNCHTNCAIFYQNYSKEHSKEAIKIVTGWALSTDQTWYQHSWLYLTKNKIIIETTLKRIMYFGFILNDEETSEFCFNNY